MILELQNVTKEYTKRRGLFKPAASFKAVHGVSFSIAKGESMGLVGESGCGKSTLAKLIMNMESPTSGQIKVKGQPVGRRGKDTYIYKHAQLVLQDASSSLYPGMCVREVLEEPLRNFHSFDKEGRLAACRELLDLVGLDASFLSRYPHGLSGGQKQRVCIAKALAARPDLIIFDESIASLDPPSQNAIVRMLKQVQKQQQIAFLFITHDLQSAEQLCGRIMVMYEGEIIETVQPGNHRSFSHPYTRLLFQSRLNEKAEQLI
ncbi:dipeptide/oligopeptide/nickel ABC transporter ATP-binding protein [Domibacillus sp. PGB-M46]|uniref:ABC transporter ATP-binding protein n=1 Tax=Domibacillus sp. PGB-M46 TaxID=2910255 RepID=UPI001F57F60C|nr:dipeptide/oligopeptide/nickel ABC transporter ATP-binding protein [Domibacillus sp. PGB-M46]MCI2256335.1 dipeptide/oligopeptide/nickel ABC transporter ATP-binding protein [Domibacillus sp. PGB-M46]